MKTYDETIASVFDRIGRYEDDKKRRNRTVAIASASVCCLCLAALTGIMIWQSGKKGEDIPMLTHDASANDSQNQQIPDTSNDKSSDDDTSSQSDLSSAAPDRPVFWGNETSGSGDAGYVTWNGKSVSCALYDVLSNDEYADHVIAISTGFIVDEDFVYNGKTIKEYALDVDKEHELTGKFWGLLKVGDELKYGEALYTTGSPDGYKWAKELYEETVAYYGEELLDKYIVDGEFLKEQLESDIEKYSGYRDSLCAYENALSAYRQHSAEEAAAKLNVPCEFDAYKECLTLFATAEEFATISLDNAQYYGLAVKNTDPDHAEDFATDCAAT